MIIIAFGANLDGPYGAPVQTYDQAIKAIEIIGIKVDQYSSLWKSAPVDVPDEQPDYFNAVIEVQTDLAPDQLLNKLLEIETQMGRKRPFRNAAKSIDLDLIAYHNTIIKGTNDQDLTLPHPRMHLRGFVLYPLQEIVPDWLHPETGESLAALIANLPEEQYVERLT